MATTHQKGKLTMSFGGTSFAAGGTSSAPGGASVENSSKASKAAISLEDLPVYSRRQSKLCTLFR
jgi:hypothetical protein